MNIHKTGKRGASPTYSDLAIATMSTMGSVMHLRGRQTEGFITSLFQLMGVTLSVPDHSTVSRRLGKLSLALPVVEGSGARHVVVDSTGVKVYGEGEWNVHQHGYSKRRTWRKRDIVKSGVWQEIKRRPAAGSDWYCHRLDIHL